MRLYLLDVEQLQREAPGCGLCEKARNLIDSYRREKADKCRKGSARGLSLGAGLALQLAVRGYTDGDADEDGHPIYLTAGEAIKLLEGYGEPVELTYLTNENGKPYLNPDMVLPPGIEKIPFISLSHSGSFVALAVSEHETGTDIQQKKLLNTEKISGRFFTESENALISEDRNMFFTIWSRKEAWGKCEGGGLAPAIKMDFSDISGELSQDHIWYEGNAPEGYALCVCEKRNY
jgi:phosphopantetheinyl transferase (holo-ACP synthase)